MRIGGMAARRLSARSLRITPAKGVSNASKQRQRDFRGARPGRTKHLPDVPIQEARARLRRALQAEGFS